MQATERSLNVRERAGVVCIAASAVLLALPSVAFANAGVPMLALVWPGMGIVLLPVIAIEAVVLARRLHLPMGRSLLISATANFVSTLAGIPLTWAALFGLQAVAGGGGVGPDIGTLAGKLFAVTVQAPWLLPYETDLYWMVPVATLVLLVPFFFASWAIEFLVGMLMLKKEADRPSVNGAVRLGNLVTYGLLASSVVVALVVSVLQHKGA